MKDNIYSNAFLSLENPLSNLWTKVQTADSGIITAFDPESTTEENFSKCCQLKSKLLESGYSVTDIDGIYVKNYAALNEKRIREKSFIVFDAGKTRRLKEDLKHFGEMYEQNAVTFHSISDNNYYLIIGTSRKTDTALKYGQELKVGKIRHGIDGTYYCAVKGCQFLGKTISEKLYGYNNLINLFPVWYIKINADKITLAETSFSKLMKKYPECDSGIITAYRTAYTDEENSDKSSNLRAVLLGAGYSVTNVSGTYIEEYDTDNERRFNVELFFVIDRKRTGKLKEHLKILGEYFEQDEIIFNSGFDAGCYLLEKEAKYYHDLKLDGALLGKGNEIYLSARRKIILASTISEDFQCYDDVITNHHPVWAMGCMHASAKKLLVDID